MSDQDTSHLLAELQEARAEIDRLSNQMIKAKEIIQGLNKENKKIFKDLEKITANYLKILYKYIKLLQPSKPQIGPLPGEGGE